MSKFQKPNNISKVQVDPSINNKISSHQSFCHFSITIKKKRKEAKATRQILNIKSSYRFMWDTLSGQRNLGTSYYVPHADVFFGFLKVSTSHYNLAYMQFGLAYHSYPCYCVEKIFKHLVGCRTGRKARKPRAILSQH